jgi:DNA (cytosine-5)-methyltransferase 1
VVYDARGNGDGEVTGTITGDHESRVTDYTALVMNERQYALTVGEDVANTLTGTDFKGTQCVFEPKTLKIRSGCEGGGKGPLVQDNLSATLSTRCDQTLFQPVAYGICSFNSHAMLSVNPDAGVYEADTSRTLDTSVPDPNKNAGGMAIVAFCQNQRNEVRDLNDVAGALGAEPGAKQQTYVLEGNGARPSHRGEGIGEGVSFTLNTIERHAVCYRDSVGSLCASDYKFPQQQQIEEGKAVVERDAAASSYVVRRLTPAECALLQGFPLDWCSGLETPEPTEEDIAFWSEVFEMHRLCAGTAKKPKTKNQIAKWLKDPYTDSAAYKMWGNGVALPCVVFVLSGIARCVAEGAEKYLDI